MIPTRGRPELIGRAVASVLGTSQAEVAVYIDDDQFGYDRISDRRVHWFSGPRRRVAPSTNWMIRQLPPYDWYGLITDDSEMRTIGWDRWLGGRSELVVSPAHNHGQHVDMPFVHRRWIDRLGWFAHPKMLHYGWPSVIHILAMSIPAGLVYAGKDDWFIQHDQHEDGPAKCWKSVGEFILKDPRGVEYVTDSVNFYRFMMYEYDQMLRILTTEKVSS